MNRAAEATIQLSFALTIFAGATLLFACQPMIARMIVPYLGGAPLVWIVCSLCFQTLLLAGYGYVHLVGTRLRVRGQILCQLALVSAVFLVMPVSVDAGAVERWTAGHPTIGLLLLLVRAIGLPFFVLSTSSPLLQRWFSELGERDPYHLYSASNAGSMLALLGYPLAVEPLLAVRAQARALQVGFAVYAVCVVLCASLVARRRPPSRIETTPAPPGVRPFGPASVRRLAPPRPADDTAREVWMERAVWIALSFAPSSLLLGVTEYVTTDIASVPLLWVVPLALYLLSFIVAFARRQVLGPAVIGGATIAVSALASALTVTGLGAPWLVVGAHVLLLLFASVACHRALAERRPPVARLTEFYLLLSIGGVLGGIFDGIVAPLVFVDLYEYPIAIGLACLGCAALGAKATATAKSKLDRKTVLRDVGLGLGVGAIAFILAKAGVHPWLRAAPVVLALVLGARRPVRYAVAIASVLLVVMSAAGQPGTILLSDRGFFGVLKVMRTPDGRFQRLLSGRALEGEQTVDPAEERVPLAFYYPTGPAGDVLGPLPDAGSEIALPSRKIGVIGLGVGSLAAYARPGDEWTFFEINPAVVGVARRWFTYLEHAEASAAVRVEIGDARLRLREGAAERFDILVLDAFASESVPTHLVTREALAVYRRALRPGGLLLVHVSNDHVKLAPVFAALARDARMVAAARQDDTVPADEQARGKVPSDWVLVTESHLAVETMIRRTHGWRPLAADQGTSVWTDDFANVLASLRF